MELTPEPIADFYKRRVCELEVALQQAGEPLPAKSLVWVGVGTIAAFILYRLLSAHILPPWAWIPAIPFAVLVLRQAMPDRRGNLRLLTLSEYYEKGIARLERKWDSLDQGNEFADAEHIYAPDLDLFGRGSLFQLMCSARTQAGRETLAAWMKTLAKREDVIDRRTAAAELRSRQSLREKVAAAGTTNITNCRPETFREWVAGDSSQGFPGWLPVACIVIVAALVLAPLLYWSGVVGFVQFLRIILGLLCLEGIVAGLFRRRVRFALENVRLVSVELPVVQELISIVENEKFSSPRLCSLAASLNQNGRAASQHLRTLSRLLNLLDQRDDPWFAILYVLLLWTTQFTLAIDRWRSRHGAELLTWLAVLGEFEALVCLSTYANENPQDSEPELLAEASSPVFNAKSLGHPLLDIDTCVRNDLHLGESVRFLIVSGSNMSGKSTFLRAVGLNAVLAWMGARVRCATLSLSPFSIGAAIRLADSLAHGRSHFFVEMRQLRRLIDLAGEGPLLFLADEIMSGTNSHDRRIATDWVVKALVQRGAIGLITTHDLALAEIASNGLPGDNVCFEDSGENGNLLFDYKLRPGVLTHSNALNIARALGIDTAALGAAQLRDLPQK